MEILMISDAAKEVKVESHVLRYWEEELGLPIRRNEYGHRYYTREDVECFKRIKDLKDRGLQLKAIKTILQKGGMELQELQPKGQKELQPDGPELQVPRKQGHTECPAEQGDEEKPLQMAIEILESSPQVSGYDIQVQQEKSLRLRWLLKEAIRDAVAENNRELCKEIKESVIKELDYQFRMREEREDEREERALERTEAYYRKVDELLRKKSNLRTNTAIMQKEKSKHREFPGIRFLFQSALKRQSSKDKTQESAKMQKGEIN